MLAAYKSFQILFAYIFNVNFVILEKYTRKTHKRSLDSCKKSVEDILGFIYERLLLTYL